MTELTMVTSRYINVELSGKALSVTSSSRIAGAMKVFKSNNKLMEAKLLGRQYHA